MNTTPMRACAQCGATGTLVAREVQITQKQRVKFGVFYVLLTLLVGFGLLLWLIMPRKNVVVNVDRYMECTACGAKLPN